MIHYSFCVQVFRDRLDLQARAVSLASRELLVQLVNQVSGSLAQSGCPEVQEYQASRVLVVFRVRPELLALLELRELDFKVYIRHMTLCVFLFIRLKPQN